MQCTSPMLFTGGKKTLEDGPKGHEGIKLPCGRCRACRIAKSREWYVRLWHENAYWEDAVFATFTYNDMFVPIRPYYDGYYQSLEKVEFQYLVKRIRETTEKKIKYYGCGEYGDEKLRPHYHMIIFGQGIKGHKTVKTADGYLRAVTGPLVRAWQKDGVPKGQVVLGSVTKDSMRYVTDYIHKKLYGKAALEDNRVQPFSLCSQGIGKRHAIENAEYYYHELTARVFGQELGMPRAYVKWLGLQEKMKEQGEANAIIKSIAFDKRWKMLEKTPIILNGNKIRDKKIVQMEGLKGRQQL